MSGTAEVHRRNPQGPGKPNPEVRTRVLPEMKREIEAIARANERSVSAELNMAIRQYVMTAGQDATQDYREVDRG